MRRPLAPWIASWIASVGPSACAGGAATSSATAGETSTTSSAAASSAPASTDATDSPSTTSNPTSDELTTGCASVCSDLGAPCSTPEDFACDLWGWGDEDCCEGEKCSPWAKDGSSSWSSHRCVPVDPDPDKIGEPCTVVGSGGSGLDSCEKGAMCWNVDPESGAGVCVGLCHGDPAQCGRDPASCCPDGLRCTISSMAVLILCLQPCDPLAQACEGPDDGCYPVNGSFQCAPDVSGDQGAAGDPCEFVNACDPATFCGDPSYPGCDPDAIGCCVPFCDLGDPQCVDGTACVAFFDPDAAPAGLEDVGACTIPP
ncbi:MAG: hypothetical protein R3B09_23595 [Nannocystaceae bacterium]